MWNSSAAAAATTATMAAAVATEASLNLAPLIAPDAFHRSQVVSCLFTGEKGRVWGGMKARDIILNGWGWGVGGLNGVICSGIYSSNCHGDSPPLLTDWLPTSSFSFSLRGAGQRGKQRGITRDWQRGTSEEFSIDYFPSEVSYVHPFSSGESSTHFLGWKEAEVQVCEVRS